MTGSKIEKDEVREANDAFLSAVISRVPAKAVEAVKGSLVATRVEGIASIEFYFAALVAAGKNPDSLTFSEVVEVTRKLYPLSADYRRDRAAEAAKTREVEAEARKAEAERKKAEKAAERAAKDRDAVLAYAKANPEAAASILAALGIEAPTA